jgi:hypothetical protein
MKPHRLAVIAAALAAATVPVSVLSSDHFASSAAPCDSLPRPADPYGIIGTTWPSLDPCDIANSVDSTDDPVRILWEPDLAYHIDRAQRIITAVVEGYSRKLDSASDAERPALLAQARAALSGVNEPIEADLRALGNRPAPGDPTVPAVTRPADRAELDAADG